MPPWKNTTAGTAALGRCNTLPKGRFGEDAALTQRAFVKSRSKSSKAEGTDHPIRSARGFGFRGAPKAFRAL